MAIPGQVQSFNVQAANGTVLVSWVLSAGATSYDVQRSQDNVTFASIATISGTPLATSYLDTTVTLGTQYFYKVAAVNASGTSVYTTAQSAIPVATGEMSLAALRLAAMQRADRINSGFVTLPEWRTFINLAVTELYNLLVTTYEDYYIAQPVQFTTDGTTSIFPLPNGVQTFVNAITPSQTLKAEPVFKLRGVDLAITNATNSWVTLDRFNFSDRNQYAYQNSASTPYGVYNMQYRLLGANSLQLIPTPSAGQTVRIWYIPKMKELLLDTDTTTVGINGFIDYVIVRAAKYALDKEESDTSTLTQEIAFLKQTIEETAANRDAGSPERISDTTRNNRGGFGDGFGGYR